MEPSKKNQMERCTRPKRSAPDAACVGLESTWRNVLTDLICCMSNPKEWDYLMFHMCKDKDGNDYGWAKVLEYIGVGWDPTTIGENCKGQMNLEDFID